MVTSMAWGYNVTIVDGITNGTITASSTADANATVTLTVTPSDGYYITANDITITQTGSGSMAQTRTDPDIAAAFHPVAGTIDAEGKGTYTFTMPVSNVKIEATFTARTVVTEATVNLSATSFTFNGSLQQPTVTSVTKGETTYLTSESTNGYADYVVSIPNSINATESPFTVEVTFRGKYIGTATVNYNITQASIDDVSITAVSDQTFTGFAIEPTPTVTLGDYTLVAGTDFNFSYTTDHTNVGEKTVTVTGLNGNFDTATKSVDYNITVKAITNVNITIADQEYTGSPLTPDPVVIDPDRGTTPLVKGTDYTVDYSENNTELTDAVTVTITGMGNYDNTTTANTTFKIIPAKLTAATLNSKITLSSTSLGYTGNPVAPTVTIDGMTEGTDYEVKYKSGNAEATATKPTNNGTYSIVIVGKGNYTGEVVTNKTFQISKAASAVATAPVAKTGLVYNGEQQDLITGGSGTNGTMQYSLDNKTYSTAIPKGKDPGTYTVYYKVVGNANYADTEAKTLSVTIAEPAPQIVDQTKPVTFEGQTFYELQDDVVDAIDYYIRVTVALPAMADMRTKVTSSGGLVFSKGTDINIIIRNVKKYQILKFDFDGRIFCNGSQLWRILRSRGGVDEELISGAEYEVRTTGDMIFTLKLADEEAVLKSISLITPPPTAIEAIEGDAEADQWFDLNGRQISKPVKKGFYIRNGKKVIF